MRLKNLTYTLAAVALFALAACSTTPEVAEGEFLIRGHFGNIPDSAKINIFRTEGNLGIQVAQDTIFNGSFELRGEVPLEGEHRFNITGQGEGFESRYYELWLSSGDYVEITGETALNADWRVKSRSSMQRSHTKFLDSHREVSLELGALSAEEDVIMQKVYAAMRNQEEYSQYRAPRDSIRALQAPIRTRMDIEQLEYMQRAKVDDYWIYRLSRFANSLDYESDSVVVSMIKGLESRIPKSRLETPEVETILAHMYPPVAIGKGDMLPDVEFFDAEGASHSLSEFRGKYILLDFFSRGCGPCIMALPEMQKVSVEYADKLEVVSISSDNKEMWLEFLASDQAKDSTYHHWNELVAVPQLYLALRVRGIPSFVVVDPEGRIEKVWSGYYNGYIRKQLPKQIKAK
ncbi:MAG: TlpA disulfide reductase family protein [Rikenellaceae bacterium]